MKLMNYFVDVVHRNACFMTPADYLTRHGGNLWWDPLISEHNAYADMLRKKHPAPNDPFTPDMMPGHRHGRGRSNMKEQRGVQQRAVTSALLSLREHRDFPISIYPSIFAMRSADSSSALTSDGLCNGGWSTAEYKSTRFPWMLYGVRECQLLSACKAAGAPVDVVLACDPNTNVRMLLCTY